MDGFLLIDKEKGITSMSCCNKIKHKFNLNKCGHNGTLDPNTTGILVMGINRGTKLMKLINEHDKTYEAKIVFGLDSDTLDICGKITQDYFMEVLQENLTNAINELKNSTKQIPPMTSAIKINGRKLYEYQRSGIEIDIAARDIKIYNVEQISDLVLKNGHYEVDLRLSVSKGFYVRSFARDLGEKLNGCAILKELRRTIAGNFDVKDAKDVNDVTIDDVIPITKFFDLPKVEVNDYIAKLVKNGITLDNRQTSLDTVFYVCNNCDIIAIYEPVSKGQYKPILIF